MRFVIPGRLSSQNEVIRDAAYNRYGGGAKRKKEKNHCYWAIIEQMNGCKPFTQPVVISFAWYEPNAKRDIDNIAAGGTKVICDALVMAKVIPNDTREWVRGIVHSFPQPDKKNPRIEVDIEVFDGKNEKEK